MAANQPEPFGVALVGLDHWYNAFPMAEALRASRLAELRWVIGADAQRARAVAGQYGAANYATEVRRALDDPSVQAVVCFTSVDQSADLCVAAAGAGKHLVSIKPMAMDLEQAGRIVEAVQRNRVKYFPGSASYLFFASHQAFKTWISEGRIGKLVAAHGVFHAGLPQSWPDRTAPGWFTDPQRVPGGAWIDHAIFIIQAFRDIFGAEVRRVSGTMGNLKHLDLGVEDYGQATLEFSNGGLATIQSTWLGADAAHRQSLEFYGTQGTIVWDTLLGKVALAGQFDSPTPGWSLVDRPADRTARATGIIEHLIDCARCDKETLFTVADDRAALAAALAFYAAARQGKAVDVL